jgi:hypothetical protein
MSAPTGRNEGVSGVTEFVCDAILAPGIAADASPGRGVNEGVRGVTEFVMDASSGPLPEGRESELRSMSTADLLTLVRSCGREVSAEELRFIHGLAIERLTRETVPLCREAEKLSREAMQAAVKRIA